MASGTASADLHRIIATALGLLVSGFVVVLWWWCCCFANQLHFPLQENDVSEGDAAAAAASVQLVEAPATSVDETLALLTQKFSAIETLMKSHKATPKGLLLAGLKTRQVKLFLEQRL